MKTQVYLLVFAALVYMSLATADGHFSDDSRVIVDGRSGSAGSIGLQFSFAPTEDGSVADSIDVEVMVPKGAKAKDIQTTIENNIRASLGDERYRIKTSGSKKVIVKTNRGTPDFAITLTNNNVQGVSVEIED